jgi:hypothetical protein
LQFFFTGFNQTLNIRHFAFRGVPAEPDSVPFVVSADVSLLRKYGISLQDAPLICLRMLEALEESARASSIVLTEDFMSTYARARVADREAAALKRKHPKPHGDPQKLGAAWRSRQP